LNWAFEKELCSDFFAGYCSFQYEPIAYVVLFDFCCFFPHHDMNTPPKSNTE
jgi:hypothetical protein